MQYTRNLGTGNGIELIKLSNTVTLIVNNPIPDITVEMNSADTTIDLSSVFFTSSQDPIAYNVENQTNPSLVTATIADGELTLSFTADQSGTDEITIEASVSGKSVTDEFVVTVNPGTGISTSSDLVPTEYELLQNYPNPFNPETTIGFALPKQSDVIISIYDNNGRHVTDLIRKNKSAGYHTVNWNAANMPSGLYFYQIKADNFTQIKKCILVK
jgi:flagellar hook assembly protein FlgD